MEARIVRENLQKCYYFEGVNHYANCKDLADKYSKMIRDNKVRYTRLMTTDSRFLATRSSTRSRSYKPCIKDSRYSHGT